ncbi:E1 ubiquitin-activating protein uba2 [Saitozyma podzolica]|uniref:E1 ubiquitin-activating protein uba2 n=1 Tax=Saitozyma podzolica TaxID=1890683 RepID=A0A427YVX5_9TREE|nr:E1 ubiquitin-activating protein uba2 [Saitozyma podzolica]
MPRATHTKSLLGPEVYAKVRDTRVLVVGAGGIGCELLKNLVLVGFANIEIHHLAPAHPGVSFSITISVCCPAAPLPRSPANSLTCQIDLDTIDLSNLNRQFLFRKPDISKPKALVAAATARHFNPSSGINIHARHGNVKEKENDLEWIKGFGLVMNALDNMGGVVSIVDRADARRHVNRLCQAAGVPLIESGTAGYLGQATPIIKDRTECYDCVPKEAPKSFPVCTIRATPSEPIHCIVWAKSYLFGKLFGEDDEAVDEEELDKAKAEGENAEEIDNLKKEAAAFREVRRALGEEDGPRRVFEKVFHQDIERLLSMDDMWKVPGRVKPKALDYDAVVSETFVPPPPRTPAASQPNGSASASTSAPASANGPAANGNGAAPPSNGVKATAPTQAQLKDQRELSVKENLELFVDSCRRLSARAIAHPNVLLSFDKDDDDTLDFVLATANLRATAYGIANKTRFQVKEMAGNIIPAIATTNAIIAGMIVMQAITILSSQLDKLRTTFVRSIASNPLGMAVPSPPNPACPVCRDVYVPFKVDTTKCTLGELVLEVVKGWLGEAHADEDLEWTVLEGGRILADPDFDDNHDKTLEELKIERGKMITVIDEDQVYRPVHFCICEPDPQAVKPFTLPAHPPALVPRPAKASVVETEPDEVEIVEIPKPSAPITTAGTKRPAPDDGDVSVGSDIKRKRMAVVVQDEDDDFEIL